MNINDFKRKILSVLTILECFDYVFGASNHQCCTKKLYYERKSSSSSSDDLSYSKSKGYSSHRIPETRTLHQSRHLSSNAACQNHLEKCILVNEAQMHSRFHCRFIEPKVCGCTSKSDIDKRVADLKERVKLENKRLDNCEKRITNIRNIKIKLKCVKKVEKIKNCIVVLNKSIRAEGLDSTDIFDLELETDSIESSLSELENYLTNHDV